MNGLLKMANKVKQLLIEVELKQIFTHLKPGDKMQVTLKNGELHMFNILSTTSGRFIVKSTENNKEYTFSTEDYTDGKLTVYAYSGGLGTDGKGTPYFVKTLQMGTPNGKIYDIDPTGEVAPEAPESEEESEADIEGEEGEEVVPNNPELESERNDYNESILSVKENDNIHIGVSVPEEGTTRDDRKFKSDNDIVLTVTSITDRFIETTLSHVEGGNSDFLTKTLNNKNIVLNKENLIKIEGDELKLTVNASTGGSNESFTIPHITYTDINTFKGSKDKGGGDRPKQTLSKDALFKMVMSDPDYKAMWAKTPGIKDTLMGASPTGVFQMAQSLKRARINSAYLEVNNEVSFDVVGRMLSGQGKTTRLILDPDKDGGYHGRVLRDRVIISGGHKDKVHWEIELTEKRDETTYDVKYMFCTKADRCVNKGKGIIKITDIKSGKRNQ